MITDRMIELDDLPLLAISLARDEHHRGTEPEFFTETGSVCKVYSDEIGAVLFARGSKALRLDLQFVDNADGRRNLRVMLEGFGGLVEKARENGFSEVIFQSDSPLLKKFCVKRLGFHESQGELRKHITT